jgi:ABC-type uncharacterized transport system auxiliary subunit
MKSRYWPGIFCAAAAACALAVACAKVPVKQFYVLNYEPEPMKIRNYMGPYPYTVRVKEFDIEEAYARPQIVYRKSPFQLQYYFFRVWAVKPTRMITDIVHKHLAVAGLFSHVVRRFDEATKPEYEFSGFIEAIEEYDNDNVWFAHLALRLKLTRLADNRTLYSRRFDRRKQVHQQNPEYVIRELSQIMDFIMTQAIHDVDVVLAKEFGIPEQPAPADSIHGPAEELPGE